MSQGNDFEQLIEGYRHKPLEQPTQPAPTPRQPRRIPNSPLVQYAKQAAHEASRSGLRPNVRLYDSVALFGLRLALPIKKLHPDSFADGWVIQQASFGQENVARAEASSPSIHGLALTTAGEIYSYGARDLVNWRINTGIVIGQHVKIDSPAIVDGRGFHPREVSPIATEAKIEAITSAMTRSLAQFSAECRDRHV